MDEPLPPQFVEAPVGRVLAVRGAQASIGLPDTPWTEPEQRRASVGRFVGISGGSKIIVGVITECSVQTLPIARERGFGVTATVDLMGEIRMDRDGKRRFTRGVTLYPSIGDATVAIGPDELEAIYGVERNEAIEIGTLQQDAALPGYINVEEMLTKHFVVLGATGVGKSSGVAVILNEILDRRPDVRLFLIDPHNEYGRCFGARAQVLNPANLRLPFWLFNFEETVDIIFRGRPGVEDEVDILAELIPVAKKAYGGNEKALRRQDARVSYTVDTPVPFRLTDLVRLIDERMGRLENRVARSAYSKLLMRIESVANDPRYAFTFENANVGGDTMSSIVGQLFRLPIDNRPMTVMQLAGFPVEVVDAVVSVLGRMAFDFGLWSDGKLPLLFVCEEAHRYASADRSIGFGPTRRAISRIAKEGRKYGVHLGLITQRPAELDATIVSQCSTIFAMRMANERDQALVRAAVSDAAANLLGFVPALGVREVFAFGEGVAVPTRIRFKELPREKLPRSEAVARPEADFGNSVDESFIDVVVDRWRNATVSGKLRLDPFGETVQTAIPDRPAEPEPVQTRLDSDRYRLLRKTPPGG